MIYYVMLYCIILYYVRIPMAIIMRRSVLSDTGMTIDGKTDDSYHKCINNGNKDSSRQGPASALRGRARFGHARDVRAPDHGGRGHVEQLLINY